jgi:hypothetical protein
MAVNKTSPLGISMDTDIQITRARSREKIAMQFCSHEDVSPKSVFYLVTDTASSAARAVKIEVTANDRRYFTGAAELPKSFLLTKRPK